MAKLGGLPSSQFGSELVAAKKPDPKDSALDCPWGGIHTLSPLRQSAGVVEHCKITNPKHQITNKSQIPILNDLNRFGISNFGHCDLFDICDL